MRTPWFLPLLLLTLAAIGRPAPAAEAPTRALPYFKIRVVDRQTGRGVPLVELRTVHHESFLTDSNGLVAFYEPGLMNQRVFFYVHSDGYTFPKDGFGYRGVALETREHGSAEIRIERVNVAERLYRITGAGIYRDSVLLGEPVPIRQPLVNGGVLGQDSAVVAVWHDRLWWFWGDTNRAAYPLGLFQTSGATSQLPGRGGLDPSQGIDLDYAVDAHGFSRAMVPMQAPGPIWIFGLSVVPDDSGTLRLAAHYSRMKDLGHVLEHGLVVFDEQAGHFVVHKQFDPQNTWRHPVGHPIEIIDQGRKYLAFPNCYATVRVPATLAALADPAQYEAFTCLAPGERMGADAKIARDAAGRPIYAWKANTAPLSPAEERQAIALGKLRAAEAYFQPRDVETGRPIELHFGSIAWNAFRKRWILIAVEKGGASSYLGEVWFSDADAPTGPWLWARKILTHDRYTFYNPVHHPFFDQQGGRMIYLEGTYANTFSGNPHATPRYDYNQILYRLDLADPRLERKTR